MGTDDNNYSSDVARGDAGAQSTATYTTSSATPAIQNTTATNQAATATNQNTGGGLAHNNLQPYIVLNYIIKT
jgi:microcystin-dependent protein